MAALHTICFITPKPWAAAEFQSLLSSPLCFSLIEAEGFLIGRAVAGEAELLTLAVAPQARRRGMGAKLVTRFLYQARLRGAEDAFLEVSAENVAAIALYGKAGFTIAGRRRAYYCAPDGTTADALILRRPLPKAAAPTST